MSWNHNGSGRPDATGVEYLNGLYSYALILTRNHAEAEDLVQETYFRAVRAMERLRTDSNVKGWLLTILRNVWLNQLRSRRNAPEMVRMELDDRVVTSVVSASKDPLELYVEKMETEQVRTAIQKLPIQLREVILLREYEDLSYQEIANVLDCPTGTVMSRLARARAKLRLLIPESDSRGRNDSIGKQRTSHQTSWVWSKLNRQDLHIHQDEDCLS
jgi:RNA polymerase sigma-70 factor (ECF subfamily)